MTVTVAMFVAFARGDATLSPEQQASLAALARGLAERPQLRVSVDRDRAADLGISLQTVSRTLETVLGSRNVTTFIDSTASAGNLYEYRVRAYNVIGNSGYTATATGDTRAPDEP